MQSADRDVAAAHKISVASAPMLIIGLLTIFGSWAMFFTAPIQFVAGLLACIASGMYGIGPHGSSIESQALLLKLRSESPNGCPGCTPIRHIRNLFLAASVFGSLSFVATLIGAAVWLPCKHGWDEYSYNRYNDDDFYGGGGGEEDPCYNYELETIEGLYPAIEADENTDLAPYSQAVCSDVVTEVELKAAFFSLWQNENALYDDPLQYDSCGSFPSSWEATQHFPSFAAYLDFASASMRSYRYSTETACESELRSLYVLLSKPTCHASAEDCSASDSLAMECTELWNNFDFRFADGSVYCDAVAAEEHSDIVGCFTNCFSDEESLEENALKGLLEGRGLKKVYNSSGIGDFSIYISKSDINVDDFGHYHPVGPSDCSQPTSDGAFAIGSLISCVLLAINTVLTATAAHSLGKLGSRQVAAAVVVAREPEIEMNVFSNGGNRGVGAGGVGGSYSPTSPMLGGVGGGSVPVNLVPLPALNAAMMQRQLDEQRAMIEMQGRLIARNSFGGIPVGGPVGVPGFGGGAIVQAGRGAGTQFQTPQHFYNLDGTIAQVPEATAVDARYEK